MTAGMYVWHAEARRLAQSALSRGAHALLLAGARGLGKREFALELAAAYLCDTPTGEGQACRSCESCHWLGAGTHPDFCLVEPPVDEENAERVGNPGAARARPIGIDQIRQLGELLAITAHRDAGKVVVICPAESLNVAASNALLKNLEEPPPRSLFLLVSDRPALLLATVRSRCQTVPIRIRDHASAASWLGEQGIENPALQLALNGGAPLEAAAHASDPAWSRRPAFLAAVADEAASPVAIAEAFRDLAPGLVLSWLQKWTFDVALMRSCGRLRYHLDMQAAIRRLSATTDPVAVTRLHRSLLALQRHVNHPLNPRLFLEHILIVYARALAAPGGPGS